MSRRNSTIRTLVPLISILGGLFTLQAVARESEPSPELLTDGASRGAALRRNQGSFGVLSDVHFNPFYDSSLVDKLADTPPERWNSVFETSSVTQTSTSRTDTNYPLFKSTLRSMATRARQFDYVLFVGDLLAHDFQDSFERYATDHSPLAYRRFVLKTMRYVAQSLRATFPRIPIITTLGNNDTFCDDYSIEPAGEFLYDTKETIASLVGDGNALASYPELGAYVVAHPKIQNHYFMVFDNLYFALQYRNSCGLSFTDPAQSLLLWVEATLYRMKRTHASVTIVAHVPLGINAYSSTGICTNKSSANPYLTTTNGTTLLGILGRYPDQIEAIFAGHSHMDDFRVLSNGAEQPYAFQRIVPSISPFFGNNPSYQIYSYERTSGTLANYQTFCLGAAQGTGAAAWAQEYDFAKAYGIGSLTAENQKALADKIVNDPAVREQYIKYFTGGANSTTISDKNWLAFACAQTRLDATSFYACLCKSPKPTEVR